MELSTTPSQSSFAHIATILATAASVVTHAGGRLVHLEPSLLSHLSASPATASVCSLLWSNGSEIAIDVPQKPDFSCLVDLPSHRRAASNSLLTSAAHAREVYPLIQKNCGSTATPSAYKAVSEHIQASFLQNADVGVRSARCQRVLYADLLTMDSHVLERIVEHQPFVLAGSPAASWPALAKWTNEYLRTIAGSETVHVKIAPNGVFEGSEPIEWWCNVSAAAMLVDGGWQPDFAGGATTSAAAGEDAAAACNADVPPHVLKRFPYPHRVVGRPATMDMGFSEFLDIAYLGRDKRRPPPPLSSQDPSVDSEGISSAPRDAASHPRSRTASPPSNLTDPSVWPSFYIEYLSLASYLPQLLPDVPRLHNLEVAAGLTPAHQTSTNIWFGDGNTIGKLHFDPFENFLAMVSGNKTVVLYHPYDNDGAGGAVDDGLGAQGASAAEGGLKDDGRRPSGMGEGHIREAQYDFYYDPDRGDSRSSTSPVHDDVDGNADATTASGRPGRRVESIRQGRLRRRRLMESTSMVNSAHDIAASSASEKNGGRRDSTSNRFTRKPTMECSIGPGEVLYLPSFWWHEVISYPDADGRNIALNYWYEPLYTKPFPCPDCKLRLNEVYANELATSLLGWPLNHEDQYWLGRSHGADAWMQQK